MNNLPDISRKHKTVSLFALAVGFIAPIFAIFYVDDTIRTTLLILFSYTILRIGNDYETPFSTKPLVIEYLFISATLSIVMLSNNITVSLVSFLLAMVFLRTIGKSLYRKDADKAIETALQTKNSEDALIALLRLKRQGQLDEENHIHKKLFAIYNKKGVEG